MVAAMKPGAPMEDMRKAGDFFREKGVQSRPIHAHGIDLVTDGPHIFKESVHAHEFEKVLKPGMVLMPEPNPIIGRRPARHVRRPHLHHRRDGRRVRRRLADRADGGAAVIQATGHASGRASGMKARLRAGQSLIGTYVTLPSPEVVELLACAGLDFLNIDLQHASPDWRTLAHMVRAADVRGVSTVVRVPDHDPARILKVLELGVECISLPGTGSVDDIRGAVAAMYYAPVGQRGACGHTRAGSYNPRRSEFAGHTERQNERVCLWALIEDPDAIKVVGDIAGERPGADIIGVGRGDLSTALGMAGQIEHPTVIAATERVNAEVRTRSRGACFSSVMVHKPEEVATWHAKGCRVFTYAADAMILMEAMRGAADACRAQLQVR